MPTKNIQTILAPILGAVLFCGVTLAQEPVVNVDKKGHPNLAQAQQLIAEANRYIVEAQKINKNDMQLHAQRARDLLVQANQELKLAEQAANAANAANAAKGKQQYHGVLAPEWQYDSYYERWLKYRAANNRGETASMEARMRDIMTHYNIPPNVPFDQVASPGIGGNL